MFKPLRSVLAIYLLVTTVCSFAASHANTPASVSTPLAIEVNRGQTAPQVEYLARSREGVLFFTEQGVTVAVPRVGAFRMMFDGAAPPEMAAEQKLMARSHYLDRNPARSITGVENYGALRYSGLYPGIDVRFYGRGNHLEHDFVLGPGADPGQIVLRFEGLDHMALTATGDVELTLGKILLRETPPIAWQVVNGRTRGIDARWKMAGDSRLGITLGEYDHSLPVTIDPVLAYSTHLGGTVGNVLDTGSTFPADTSILHIALDGQHNLYVSGITTAIDYPTTAGAFDRTNGYQEVFHESATSQSGFVSKFDPTGRILIYSTYLDVAVEAMAVDPAGHVYSAMANFTRDPGPNGGFDEGITVDKLSVDGSQLLFTTQFARTSSAAPECQAFSSSGVGGLATDNSGHLWMAGDTGNPCMPATAGAFQTKLNGSGGFVAKFDTNKAPAASLVYSTYLSGASGSGTAASSVGIDASGNAYIAGFTNSVDFPHGATFGSGTPMVFISKLNPTGSGLVFSTLLHGGGGFPGVALAIDSAHNVYVAGEAFAGFPTTLGAFRRGPLGANCLGFPCQEGFVTKLSPGGGSLLYSTFLGGSGNDVIVGLSLNSAGMAFVTGQTDSTDFPTTASAFKKTLPAGVTNAFVTTLQPDGKSLYYSTLLGGGKHTTGWSVAVDPAWNAWVAGNTQDSDYPVTPDAFQPGLKGNSDGFLAKIVIAGDLKVALGQSAAVVPRNSVVTFSPAVTNLGPDRSEAVVLTDTIPSGFSFAGISGSTATSCSTPAIGAISGSVVCHKTRLEKGQSFGVRILLRAVAPAGSTRTNKVFGSARTQDLNLSNNAPQATVVVR